MMLGNQYLSQSSRSRRNLQVWLLHSCWAGYLPVWYLYGLHASCAGKPILTGFTLSRVLWSALGSVQHSSKCGLASHRPWTREQCSPCPLSRRHRKTWARYHSCNHVVSSTQLISIFATSRPIRTESPSKRLPSWSVCESLFWRLHLHPALTSHTLWNQRCELRYLLGPVACYRGLKWAKFHSMQPHLPTLDYSRALVKHPGLSDSKQETRRTA